MITSYAAEQICKRKKHSWFACEIVQCFLC